MVLFEYLSFRYNLESTSLLFFVPLFSEQKNIYIVIFSEFLLLCLHYVQGIGILLVIYFGESFFDSVSESLNFLEGYFDFFFFTIFFFSTFCVC